MSFLTGQLIGNAAKAIAGIAITTANYPVAIEMLKERFGNNKAIIDSHYSALTTIQPAQKQRDLRAVIDQLDEHFNALKALGENVNHRHFSSLIRNKLPPAILVQMETKQQEENAEWDIDTWRDRLRKHIQICESAYHSPFQMDHTNNPQSVKFMTAPKPTSPRKGKWQSTTSSLLGQSPHRPPPQHQRRQQNASTNHSPTLAQPTKPCPYCDRIGHFADECIAIQTASARKEKLREKRLCTNCLGPSHSIRDCRRIKPCFTCKKTRQHHSSICPDRYPDARQSTTMMATNRVPQSQRMAQPTGTSGEHSLLTHNEISLLQTTKATFLSGDGQQTIQAQGVFDNGSQRSYITEQLAKQLRIKLKPGGKLTVFTFASVPPKEINTKLAELKIQLPNGSITNFNANVIPHISGNIQRQPIDTTKDTNILRDIPLADSIPVKPEKITIDFLIGADYMWEFINGEKISLSNGLHLISSVFGWLLAGRQANPMDTDNAVLAAQSITSLYAGTNDMDESDIQFSNQTEQGQQSNDITFLWDMETLGIKDKPNDPSDELAMQMFNDTVLFKDGRYFVQWPWKDPDIDLPSNYQLALGRLNSIIRRYQNEPEVFKMYHNVIEEQQRKGIIEKVDVPTMDSSRIHYIPHHGVINPEKTTKLRVVYDASAKVGESKSLNECLHRGPVMLDDVVAILVRFRLNKMALASDIEKAFLQVGLQEDERNVTRFLWLKNPEIPTTKNNIQMYRFTRVPFGFISSPFLLAATIQTHLQHDGSELAHKILQNIYVDNIITGADSKAEAIEFYNKTKTLFHSASMNAREWMTNSTEVLEKIPVGDRAMGKYKILGIPWDPTDDTLSIAGTKKNPHPQQTKRSILQTLASIYDPMGLVCPVTLQGKRILQGLWEKKVDWDEPIPTETANQWDTIWNDLSSIQNFKFPRFIGKGQSYELHGFCDASKEAYGVAIYLRIIDDNNIRSHLIFAKARLAPIRDKMTIPRLELLAVHIGTKCLEFINSALPFPVIQKLIWTDSQCVLHWLSSSKPLTVFVRNRIQKIKENTDVQFRYVNTEQNPADLASRGAPAKQLKDCSLWWNGPEFLQDTSDKNWPKFEQKAKDDITLIEKIRAEERKVCTRQLAQEKNPVEELSNVIKPEKFSSLTKLLRVTAWCIRACSKEKPVEKELTAKEIHNAKLVWIRHIQHQSYEDTIEAIQNKQDHQLVRQMGLWIDQNGIIRCGGRIQKSDLPFETVHPILLPKGSHFTRLIIHNHHWRSYHAGVAQTLSSIRNEYWIPAGRAEVFKHIRSCHQCKKYDGGPYKPPAMPQLPAARVKPSAPFTFTGIDYLGPLQTKEKDEVKKVWICLLTCLSTRAIHLEVVPDMSTEQFILALKRFCSRRGSPEIIISDNAAQFKLAKNAPEKIWSTTTRSQEFQSYIANRGIQWKFIPDRAPWMGGFYERLVRLVKQSLRKTLGPSLLSFIQLQTIITEIEAVLNSRPLVYVGSEISTGTCLTPSHFLGLNTKTGMPDSHQNMPDDRDYVDKISSVEALLQTWKKGQRRLDQFWKTWRNEYLLSLRERNQTTLKSPRRPDHNPPKVGDIVQIHNDGPRGTWQLGQVTKLITSADGTVRALKIRISSGRNLTRSVLHAYPLECNSTEEVPPVTTITTAPTTTRPHRQAAKKARQRIQRMAEEESEDEPESAEETAELSLIAHYSQPPQHNTTPQSNRRGRNGLFTTILLSFCVLQMPTMGSTITPMICQAHEAKFVLDLSPKTTCPKSMTDPIEEVKMGNIQLFKKNIAKYESTAYRCQKVKTTKKAWTGFAKTGWDHSVKEMPLAVSDQECKQMIHDHRCQEGPLLGSNSLAFTENNVDYPFTTGNAWDCCSWKTKEITNCFLTKGKVYETFNGMMESNLGNVAHCDYSKKTCTLADQSLINWETVDNAQCEYIPWRKFSGRYWNGRFLSDDEEIALTWDEDTAHKIQLCNIQTGILTDQGIPIISTLKQIKKRPKRSISEIDEETEEHSQAKESTETRTDITAARLQALEERLHELFSHGLNAAFNQACRALQKMQQIDLLLAHSEPTLIARHLLNESYIMARLNGKLLEVWPCVRVEMFTILPMKPPRCTEWIPLNITMKGKTILGYLDPKTNIVFENAAPAECKLVDEMFIRGDDEKLLIYKAQSGTLVEYKGPITSYPIYQDNLTIFSNFKEIIHKPLAVYSLDELKAHTSMNDLFDSIEKTNAIILKLADISDSQPPNAVAENILQNFDRFTPWGLLTTGMNFVKHAWIYLCCGYVTIKAIWDWIISKVHRRVWRILRPRPRAEEVATTHCSVEKFTTEL